MTDLTNLISAAVAAKMTPEFIEKQVDIRVEKLVIESVDSALRSYSDTGEMIKKAVQESLRVDRLDLPSYGAVVTATPCSPSSERLAAAEPVAVIRFDHNRPGNENEMPKVTSCDWLPDGEYALYTSDAIQAAVAAEREACAECQPSTAEDPNENAYQRGKFDGIMEFVNAIRARPAIEGIDALARVRGGGE